MLQWKVPSHAGKKKLLPSSLVIQYATSNYRKKVFDTLPILLSVLIFPPPLEPNAVVYFSLNCSTKAKRTITSNMQQQIYHQSTLTNMQTKIRYLLTMMCYGGTMGARTRCGQVLTRAPGTSLDGGPSC